MAIWSELEVLHLTIKISAIGNIIICSQLLKLQSYFKDDHLFSWEIGRLKYERINSLIKISNSYPYVIALLILRILLSLSILILPEIPFLLPISSLAIACCCIIYSFRVPVNNTGADQMLKLNFILAGLALLSDSSWVWQTSLLLIAFNLSISYCIAGWYRIVQKSWRNGIYFLIILRLRHYSQKSTWNLVKKNPGLVLPMTWAVHLFECLFPFSLLLPTDFVAVSLMIGILFHFVNAIIFGLNTFIWTFIAAYPAFFWSSVFLRQFLNIT